MMATTATQDTRLQPRRRKRHLQPQRGRASRVLNPRVTAQPCDLERSLLRALRDKDQELQLENIRPRQRLFATTATAGAGDAEEAEDVATAVGDEENVIPTAIRDETQELTARVDSLTEKYREKNAQHLRCLIRDFLANNAVVFEQCRAQAFWELDCLLWQAGGTKELLTKHLRDPFEGGVSIWRNECLVRGVPYVKGRRSPRDTLCWDFLCEDCKGQHQFWFQRAKISAAFIGAFLKKNHQAGEAVVEPSPEDVFEGLLSSLDLSHLCGNSACSDPFHVCFESRFTNIDRNNCLLLRKLNKNPDHVAACPHWPRCMPERKWKDNQEWRNVRVSSLAGMTGLPKPVWQCTDPNHHSKGGKGWTTKARLLQVRSHWTRGTGCEGMCVRLEGLVNPSTPVYDNDGREPMVNKLKQAKGKKSSKDEDEDEDKTESGMADEKSDSSGFSDVSS